MTDLPPVNVLRERYGWALAGASGRSHIEAIDAVCRGLVPGWSWSPPPHRVTCPSCGGEGWDPDHPALFCATCRGYRSVPLGEFSCACGGAGFVRGEAGRAVVCPACRGVQAGGPQAVDRLLAAGMPPVLAGASLEWLLRRSPEAESQPAVRTVRHLLESGMGSFVERAEGRRGVALVGKSGVGKSGLAAVAARHVATGNSSSVAWATWSYFLDRLRPGGAESENPLVAQQPSIDAVMSAYLLVLDDVTTEVKVSSWAEEKLWMVLEARLAWRGGFTVITSNVQPQSWRRAFSDRCGSRIEGLCVVAPLEGPDLRRP